MITQQYVDDRNIDPSLALANAKAVDGGIELILESKAAADRVRWRIITHRRRHGSDGVVMRRVDERTLRLVSAQDTAAEREAHHEDAAAARYARTWPRRQQQLRKSVFLTGGGPSSDFLMFVGSSFYTVASFVEEARRLGVSKRIASIPAGMSMGQSRVFLAAEGPKGHIPCPHCHDKNGKLKKGLLSGWRCENCKSTGHVRQNVIFGYFIPTRIDLIVRDDEAAAMRQEIIDKQINVVKLADAQREPARGCGHRQPGAVYAVSDPEDWDALVEKAAQVHRAADIEGGIAVFRRPVPYHGKHFLGIKRFDPASAGIEVEPRQPQGGEVGFTLEGTAHRGKQ
jgi:hypothetical protein